MERDLYTGSGDIKTYDEAHIEGHLIKMSMQTNTDKENTGQYTR